MHFALVIPELHKLGGTERCMASLASALERRGHRFTIFANRRDPGVLPSAKWYRVPMIARPHIPRFFSFFWAQALVRRFAEMQGDHFDVIFSTGPDVLHPTLTVFHCSAAGFAQLATEASQQRAGSFLSRVKRWNSRISYRAIARVERKVLSRGAQVGVAISRTLKNEFEHFHGARAKRLSIIPDGVDLTDFYPLGAEARARVRGELTIPDDSRLVLFVGHNWLRKGLPTLVEAVARSRDPKTVLVVVGAGEPRLQREAERLLGDRVRFVGTRPDMPAIYAAADLLALPTLSEPFGLPVLEAMACNLPVVVSKHAGVAELITDGVDGVLLNDPEDADELAAKITRMLSDSDLRQTISSAARRTAEKYSWDALAVQFESICGEAARRSRA